MIPQLAASSPLSFWHTGLDESFGRGFISVPPRQDTHRKNSHLSPARTMWQEIMSEQSTLKGLEFKHETFLLGLSELLAWFWVSDCLLASREVPKGSSASEAASHQHVHGTTALRERLERLPSQYGIFVCGLLLKWVD